MTTTPTANGSAVGSVTYTSLPPVVGINFGNSYASIAVFTKEGNAECIANEDGERQIACAVSFQGEEMYIGSQAKSQLVKNAQNTIVGFRNLLGKKFSEISPSVNKVSAAVVQHPELSDTPAYKVQVLQPAPSPIPRSTVTSPAASIAPTPRSEPILVDRYLTVSEVTTLFLKSLIKSAEDFLGKSVRGAVICVPSSFTEVQRSALEKAASDAEISILQLLDDVAAAAATTTAPSWSNEKLLPDRIQLVIDFGSSSVTLALLSIREGLAYVLASSTTSSISSDLIDQKLIKFFAADFSKKTKIPLTVCPAPPSSHVDQRAEAKLRLAVEHTKRTISASPGAATCSVESLKEGVDFTGSINRTRFDMLVSSIYASASEAILALISSTSLDVHDIDEIVYIGGTASLPGLDERLQSLVGFRESVETPFSRGTVVGGGVGDPTTVIARGCAMQAALLDSIGGTAEEDELKSSFERGSKASEVKATTKTIGILFPDELDENADIGGTWIPVVQKETALPARRIVSFEVGLSASSKRIAFELWEVTEGIRIEKTTPPRRERTSEDDDDDEDEDEEIEIKHRTVTKDTFLGALDTQAKLGIQTKGKGKDAGRWFTQVQVQVVVGLNGDTEVELREVGEGGVVSVLKVPA